MIGQQTNAAGSNTFVDEVDCGSIFDQIDDFLDCPIDDIDAAIPGGVSTSDLDSSFPSNWWDQSEVDAAIPGVSSTMYFDNHPSLPSIWSSHSEVDAAIPIWSAHSEVYAAIPGPDSSGSGLSAELSVRDQFPDGMHVLAVDDDPVFLKVLENLLRKCQYHVTATNQAVTALKMLRENRSKYDLVISDVKMPGMDGFKLLELVRLEIDLPVIMLSSYSDKDLVYKGVTHGAVDYLLKPVRMEELKNIWQHVIRKKKPVYLHQKPRVVWSVDLHQKFVQAVDQLGLDKAAPKKILDLMKVEELTRENVASHLQKYRLHLTKLSNQPAQR